MLKAALNGNRKQGSHPALPLGAGELSADAAACVRAGAAAIHLHPRDEDGRETLAGDVVDKTVRAVRLAAGVAVGVSTGAWIEPDPRRRADLVAAWREPDMASVNLSEDGAEAVMEALFDAGVGVEAGIWSVGDAERLAASGFAARVVRVLVEIVHPVDDPAAEAMTIDERLDRLGIATPRLHHGEQDATWPVLRQAVTLGRDIRIGLEDTLFSPMAPTRRPTRNWSGPPLVSLDRPNIFNGGVTKRSRYTLPCVDDIEILTEGLLERHGEVSSWRRQVLPIPPRARYVHRLGPGSVGAAVTGPPLPDGVRQDLMLPFGPIPDEAGRGVILSGDHAEAVLAYCHAMGSKFGAPGYLRYFFGLPVNKALQSGYLMTQRALRETTPHACAEEIARTALELLSGLDGGREEEGGRVLDIFAGAGQMTYSYAKAGCHVQAVDNDRTTVDVAVHNMALAGLASVVEYRLGDGPATLASAVNTLRRFSVVHLDPPWRGTYQYDLTRPFMLEGLAVDVQELVRLGLEGARLVVLNLPHNALPSQIADLAALAGCNALVQYLYVSDFPASFAQAPAYFFGRSGGGHGGTTGYQERRQRLTVDGQRVS